MVRVAGCLLQFRTIQSLPDRTGVNRRKESGWCRRTAAALASDSMPDCLIVQHVVPESAFAVGEALIGAGVRTEVRTVFDGGSLPTDCSGYDGLVVMGGPMSAASDDSFPTRQAELTLLADAVDRGVPTLGICRGAQLLAGAAGASVYPGPAGTEIGWGPVTLPDAC